MIKLQRPDYFGEWNDEHIKWFVARFANNKLEISSENVQNAHGRTKKNKGEQKPEAQDFRNLMRLVVKNRLARVTQGFSGISSYRIIIVSDDNPYNQELFSDRFALYLKFSVNLPPTQEEFSNLGDLLPDWTDRHQFEWRQESYWWSNILHAFQQYKYFGGDFEDVPPCFNPELKNNFVLRVNQLICQYRAIKLGWELIKDHHYRWDLSDGSVEHTIWKSPEHLFKDMLIAQSICRFVGHFSPKDSISPRTKADRLNLIRQELKNFRECSGLDSIKQLSKNIENPLKSYKGKYSESKEAMYCNFAGGGRFLDALKLCCDPAVKEACERWETADDAHYKYLEREYRNGGTK